MTSPSTPRKRRASIVELKFAFGVDQACVHGRQGTKEFDLVFVIIERSFEKAEGAVGNMLRSCGQARRDKRELANKARLGAHTHASTEFDFVRIPKSANVSSKGERCRNSHCPEWKDQTIPRRSYHRTGCES